MGSYAAYMDDDQMYPEMFIHMKVDIITEGEHNGMILHQSVSQGPNGEVHIHTVPEFPQDWGKRGYPLMNNNNALRPLPAIDPSRMIGWNDQATQADDEKEKRRKHRKKHRHDSEKRHRRRMAADEEDAVSNGDYAEILPEAAPVDLDSTPEFNLADESDTRKVRVGRTLPGAVPVFPMNERPIAAPRRYRDELRYEDDRRSNSSSTFVLPDRVRLNVFEEVEPARFADADIKRIESNKRPIIQYPADTEHETDAEQSVSYAAIPSDGRLSQRSEPRPMYNVFPVETLTDTVTTTTTVEVFRTTTDANSPTERLILPPPPVSDAVKLPPQLLRVDGPAHEVYQHTKTETLLNGAAIQAPRPALRRLDQRAVLQQSQSPTSLLENRLSNEPRRFVRETLIDDPGIPLRPSNGQHYVPRSGMPPSPLNDQQQRARFPPERLTSSFPSHPGQSSLTSMPKQTPEPAPRPTQLSPSTTPIRQRSDVRNEHSESFTSHTSHTSLNRQQPPLPTLDRSPRAHLSMAPMTTTDFPSDLPELPPQISPHHVIRVESLSSLSERMPPPSPLPPMPLSQQEEQFDNMFPDRSKERDAIEPVDQMFSYDRTQVRVTGAKNRPVFRPPPIPTESQRGVHAPPMATTEELSFHSEDANNGFPPAPSPLDFTRDRYSASSSNITRETFTTNKNPISSPHNQSFDRPPVRASSSSHDSTLEEEERNGSSSVAAPPSIFTTEEQTTTVVKQREIYTIEESRTSNEIPLSSPRDADSDRRNTTSSFGKPESRQSSLIRSGVIKQNAGGLSSSRSSIDSERSSVSAMMRPRGGPLSRPDGGSDGENLSDYLQERLTPLGQDLNGLYYVDDSVKSHDSVISEASNRADRSHEYYSRHRHEEQILSPPPEPRSFAETMHMSVSPPPPPPREVRFNPVPMMRRSSSSSSTASLSSLVSAHPYQEEAPRFAQVLSREPIRYDMQQPAYGEARTEPVAMLADRMRQMLQREEESLRLRSTVNTHI